ncbi:MAG TPA: hypothetical protein ENK18_02490 [Deltaproteobacteria bacterium]|nr:hypothetical protein [Deltaproteobacteria bacterium]
MPGMWMICSWMACSSPGPAPIPTSPAGPPLQGTDELWIDEALAPRCPDPGPEVSPAAGDLHRITVEGTRCNDGTPAVAYARSATDPDHADDWVLFMHGGGDCHTWQTCADRWCGLEYDAGKMSSRWATESVGGSGLTGSSPDNAFAGYNVVELPYCSSDSWLGQAPDTVLVSDDGLDAFQVHFEGSQNLMTTIELLKGGAISDDGVVSVPAMASAELVVLAGTSAGSMGAAVHLDRVADVLPGVRVLGVLDSMFYPAAEALPSDAIRAGIDGVIEDWWDHQFATWRPALDETCSLALGHEGWLCTDLEILYRTWIETPFLLNHDVWDPRIYPNAAPSGLLWDDWGAVGSDSLRIFASEQPRASFRGSACGHHAALGDPARFLGIGVVDAVGGGGPWTLHDALVSLVEGEVVVAVDEPSGAGSRCDPPAL